MLYNNTLITEDIDIIGLLKLRLNLNMQMSPLKKFSVL